MLFRKCGAQSRALMIFTITALLFVIPAAISYALVDENLTDPASTITRTSNLLTATVSFRQLKSLDEIKAGFGDKQISQFHHLFFGSEETLTGGYVIPKGESLSQALANYRQSQIEAFEQMLKHLRDESKRSPYEQKARLSALKNMEDNLQRAQSDPDAGLRIYGIVIQDTGRNLEEIKARRDVAKVQIAETPERPPMPMVPPQLNTMSREGE
jgi:hypothetical protein